MALGGALESYCSSSDDAPSCGEGGVSEPEEGGDSSGSDSEALSVPRRQQKRRRILASSSVGCALPSVTAAFEEARKIGLPHKEAADIREQKGIDAMKYGRMTKKRSDDQSEDSDVDQPQFRVSDDEIARGYAEFLNEANIALGGRRHNDYESEEAWSRKIPAGRRRELDKIVVGFSVGSEATFDFPATLSALERKFVHARSECYGLRHVSLGVEPNRRLKLSRAST